MRNWLNLLTDIIWPRGLQCLYCGELSGGELLCPACRRELEALRLSPEAAGAGGIRSVYRYDGIAKRLVIRLKMDGLRDAAAVLAPAMAETLREMALPEDVVLTWVTMPEKRLRRRWIDHGRCLCEEVARQTGLPARQLLNRTGNPHTQRGLKRESRQRNLSGSLACNVKITTPIVLVDDVFTTGATVSACTETLLAAGAPAVYAITATKVIVHRLE